jgi:hypothetical protein
MRSRVGAIVEFATIRARAQYFKHGVTREDPPTVNEDISPMTAGALPNGYASQYSTHQRDTVKGPRFTRDNNVPSASRIRFPSTFGNDPPFYQPNGPQNRLLSDIKNPEIGMENPETFKMPSGLTENGRDRLIASEYTANEVAGVMPEKNRRMIFDKSSQSRKPSDRVQSNALADAFNRYIHGSNEEQPEVVYEFDAVANFEIYFPEGNIIRIKHLVSSRIVDTLERSALTPTLKRSIGDSAHKTPRAHGPRPTMPLLLPPTHLQDDKVEPKTGSLEGMRRTSNPKRSYISAPSPKKPEVADFSFEMQVCDFPFAKDSMARPEHDGFDINVAFLHLFRKKDSGPPPLVTGDLLSGSIPKRSEQGESRRRPPEFIKHNDDFGSEDKPAFDF